MRYAIHELNIDRLEKKLKTIQNKCEKYGCEFSYERIGEEFREIENDDGKKSIERFVLIDVDGVAKVNNWRFVAVLEHQDAGNIIKKYDYNEVVPERYYDCAPSCEHCKTNRQRADTYIVKNEITGEYKQVGKNCLKDFTGGLSATAVSEYMSFFDSIIEYESPMRSSIGQKSYYRLDAYLKYVVECVTLWGYCKSDDYYNSTGYIAKNIFGLKEYGYTFNASTKEIASRINDYSFNADREGNKEKVAEMLKWIRESEASGDYIHNLKVACSSDYFELKNGNLIASLSVAYGRAKEAEEKEKQRAIENEKKGLTKFVGNVGGKIEIDVAKWRCITSWISWSNGYSSTYTSMYGIEDTDGNAYIWKTSSDVEYEQDKQYKLIGKIKGHSEYEGRKQTELTRCKLIEIEKVQDNMSSFSDNVKIEIDDEQEV